MHRSLAWLIGGFAGAAGFAASIAVAGLLRGLLFGSWDIPTLAIVTGLLSLAAPPGEPDPRPPPLSIPSSLYAPNSRVRRHFQQALTACGMARTESDRSVAHRRVQHRWRPIARARDHFGCQQWAAEAPAFLEGHYRRVTR